MLKARRSRTYDTATGGSIGQFRRAVVAYLSMLVLSFNVLAGGVLPSSMGDAAIVPSPDHDAGNVFVICTTAGMVVVGKDGVGIPSDSTVDHKRLCVSCLPLLHGDTDLPAQIAKIERPQTVELSVLVVAANLPVAASRLRGTAAPRAPPTLV